MSHSPWPGARVRTLPDPVLLLCSASVVANLWEVTDHDIDTFTAVMLHRWLQLPESFCRKLTAKAQKLSSSSSPASPRTVGGDLASCVASARESFLLRYINGAAPVCYGVPVSAFSVAATPAEPIAVAAADTVPTKLSRASSSSGVRRASSKSTAQLPSTSAALQDRSNSGRARTASTSSKSTPLVTSVEEQAPTVKRVRKSTRSAAAAAFVPDPDTTAARIQRTTSFR